MSKIRAILGLGNPGNQYQKNRHNLGYRVADGLLKKYGGKLKAGKGNYYFVPVKISGREVFILRSSTYMNNSGIGTLDAIDALNILPEELLVIFDDFVLPFGSIRIKYTGSHGGHNGLESIIYYLGTESIPRMRIGIGPISPNQDAVKFVLGDFEDNEEKMLSEILDTALEAVFVCVTRGLDRAMELFNRRINVSTDSST